MNRLNGSFFRLLMLGAGPRLGIAAGLILVLWLGFFWATAPVGGG